MDAVLLAREADKDLLIRDREFRNLFILGPAVIAPLTQVSLTNCTFETSPESIYLELPDGTSLTGIIGLRDVVFDGCIFRNISIAGTPSTIAQFRKGIHDNRSVSVVESPASASPASSPSA